MWATILKLLTSILALLGGVFAYRKKKLEEKNTSEIKQRKKAQDSIDERNKAERLVGEVSKGGEKERNKALDEIRKKMSK